MNLAWKTLVFVLPMAVSVSALSPVATLTSDEPFTLDGHSMAVTGVNSWPLVLGDEIDTLDAPVVLVFQSGAKIQVAAHSRVKLAGSSKQPNVVVEGGKIVELGVAPSGNKSASPRPLATGGGSGPKNPISKFQ
jgi:hypothetical protein